jgi:hypothetical protein
MSHLEEGCFAYHEQRNTLYGDVDEKEPKSAEVVGDVHHSPLNVMDLSLLVLIGTTLQLQSLRGDHPFAFVQEPAIFRAPRHQEWCSETNDNGKQPLEEEDVTPSMNDHARGAPRGDARETVSRLAFDACQSVSAVLHSSEQSTEGACHGCCGYVDTDTEQELVALVEAGDEEGKPTRPSC